MKGEIMEDNKLCGEFSAKVWAEEFVRSVKIKPEIATDEGTMLGWFANAIMAGYDKANQEKAGSIEVGVEEIEEIIETWFVKQESILSNEQIKEVDTKGVWQVDLKSLSFDEIKKGLAQAILNKLKEKE